MRTSAALLTTFALGTGLVTSPFLLGFAASPAALWNGAFTGPAAAALT